MSNNIKGEIGMTDKLPSAAERAGLLGRRTIRRAQPGQQATSANVGIWDIKAVKPNSRAAALQDVYLKALGAVDAAENRRAEAVKSGKFTADGIKSDLLTFGAQKLAPVLYRGRQVVEAAKREVADKRSQIKLEAPDKSDLAGALRRAELRDFLRSKPQAERDQYLRENADRLDPQMALAMLEMPAEVSGISPLQHSALVDKALEATHGETISEIKQLERAISLAEAAVDLGRTEIIKESESSVDDFNAIASAYEKGEIAWLRKSASEVHVVDLQRGVGRVPTPEELETGEYFSNYAEYAEANGLPPQPPGA